MESPASNAHRYLAIAVCGSEISLNVGVTMREKPIASYISPFGTWKPAPLVTSVMPIGSKKLKARSLPWVTVTKPETGTKPPVDGGCHYPELVPHLAETPIIPHGQELGDGAG